MTLVKKTIRQRFPKSTFLAVIMVIILAVILLDVLVFQWAIMNWLYTTIVIGALNFVTAGTLQFIAGAGIVLAVVGFILYRRKYGKKEVLMTAAPVTPLQNNLTQTSNQMYPSLNTSTDQDLVVEDK